MSTSSFRNNIEGIHIPILTEWNNSGIVFTDGAVIDEDTPPSILFSVETAREKFGASAVYFRYYSDRQTFLPQLYLFDFTATAVTEENRKEIHKRMWNGSQVPAYMIVEKTAITICNARLNPSNSNDLTEILRLSAEAFSSFQSQDLANGVFWDTLHNEERFDFDQSATKDLIRGFKKVFDGFVSDSGLDRHTALRLLMQCILIKYLEERDESNKSGYFAARYFKVNFGCDDFCSTIKEGKLLELLDLLAVDFNGKIFEWNIDTQSEARTAIRQTKVRELAKYLDANIENNQYLLWRKYGSS